MEEHIANMESRNFLEPEKIVRSLGVEKGDYVADFGAGHGYFTIPLAETVGGDGKVYAIEIQKPELDIIRGKAKLLHLLNTEFVWANLEEQRGSRLKENFLDLVLISNILFQAEHKENIIKEARRALRKKGKMAIIEWDAVPPVSFGPPPHLLIKKDQVKELAQRNGFKMEREFNAGSSHYGMLFVKE